VWGHFGSLLLSGKISRENGFFFFKFGSQEECQCILQGGPWLFDGRLIILKQWTEHLGLDRYILSSIPVCVRFPSPPLKFWSQEVISQIASIVETPLFMDRATAHAERTEYAKCFVEILAVNRLPKHVTVDVEMQRA